MAVISSTGTGLITSTGVGSGLDTSAIVEALVNAEISPKQNQITKQQTAAATQLSALGTVKSALDTYRSAISTLNSTTKFNGLAATSSDEKVATVTLGTSAAAGTYELDVTQLAKASKISTGVYDSASTSVNDTGASTTLTISQSGSDYNVTIAAGATLTQVRDQINTQLASKNISANILTDANGSRLVLSSATTGADTDLTLSGDSGLATDFTTVTTAQNAKYTIDGIEMESKSNTVTSAISGVTLKLLTEDKSTIAVTTDSDTLKTSVQSFVDAYNTMMKAITAQTGVTSSDDDVSAGALTGDSTMRSMVSSMRNELLKSFGTGAVNTLSNMGITTDQTTGLLKLDDTTWNAAVAKTGGVSQIVSAFVGDNGLLKGMTTATEPFAGTSGILTSRVNNLNTKLSDLDTQQEALDRREATLTSTLTAKYTAMDTLVAQLNATSDSIMTTLNALNKTSDD